MLKLYSHRHLSIVLCIITDWNFASDYLVLDGTMTKADCSADLPV